MSNDTIYLEISELAEYGAEIIPIFPSAAERFALVQKFNSSMAAFPEYSDSATVHQLGGLGAFANPSSFHCEFAKDVRNIVLKKVIQNGVFNRFLGDSASYYKMEVLFERMLHRWPMQIPPKESAHRNNTPPEYLSQGDVMFGGWLNKVSRTNLGRTKTLEKEP
jgi:hypothetical protein